MLTGFLALASGSAAAGSLSDVTFRIRYADGRLEERRSKAEVLPNGDARVRFRTIDMTDDMTAIDVLSDAAIVPKCDGYWTLGDCRWGRFSRDEAVVEPGRKKPAETVTKMWRMPIFGVKTPDRCFVAIVKGMPLEHRQHVQVEKGVYEVFARYDLRRIEFRPYEDIVVDFRPLAGADANYSGMARAYRAHQLTEWLRERPYVMQGKGFACTHGEFTRPNEWGYVVNPVDAWLSLRVMSESILFIGHSHVPVIMKLSATDAKKAKSMEQKTAIEGLSGLSPVKAMSFVVERGARYVVNVGSVGLPRMGSKAAYAIYDDKARSVDLIAVNCGRRKNKS